MGKKRAATRRPFDAVLHDAPGAVTVVIRHGPDAPHGLANQTETLTYGKPDALAPDEVAAWATRVRAAYTALLADRERLYATPAAPAATPATMDPGEWGPAVVGVPGYKLAPGGLLVPADA